MHAGCGGLRGSVSVVCTMKKEHGDSVCVGIGGVGGWDGVCLSDAPCAFGCGGSVPRSWRVKRCPGIPEWDSKALGLPPPLPASPLPGPHLACEIISRSRAEKPLTFGEASARWAAVRGPGLQLCWKPLPASLRQLRSPGFLSGLQVGPLAVSLAAPWRAPPVPAAHANVNRVLSVCAGARRAGHRLSALGSAVVWVASSC